MASFSNICLKSVGTTDFNLVIPKTFGSPFAFSMLKQCSHFFVL